MTVTEAMQDDAAFPPSTCHFLRLPGELRNRIYRLMIGDRFNPTPGCMFTFVSRMAATIQFHPDRTPTASPAQPGLAATGRQIRHEVLSIFYGEYKFYISPDMSAKLLKDWVNTLRQSLRYLRRIRLTFAKGKAQRKREVQQICNRRRHDRVWITYMGVY
jgi:hypothetical protein